MYAQSYAHILLPLIMKLQEGYVFTPVCVSVQGGLCAGGSLSRRVAVQAVSVKGGLCARKVSVQGVSAEVGLCPGSLCQGDLPVW